LFLLLICTRQFLERKSKSSKLVLAGHTYRKIRPIHLQPVVYKTSYLLFSSVINLCWPVFLLFTPPREQKQPYIAMLAMQH